MRRAWSGRRASSTICRAPPTTPSPPSTASSATTRSSSPPWARCSPMGTPWRSSPATTTCSSPCRRCARTCARSSWPPRTTSGNAVAPPSPAISVPVPAERRSMTGSSSAPGSTGRRAAWSSSTATSTTRTAPTATRWRRGLVLPGGARRRSLSSAPRDPADHGLAATRLLVSRMGYFNRSRHSSCSACAGTSGTGCASTPSRAARWRGLGWRRGAPARRALPSPRPEDRRRRRATSPPARARPR